MGAGRVVLLHPDAVRLRWHVAFALALGEMASHLALTAAAVFAGAVAVSLVLLLLLVSAPLGLAVVAWFLWRSAQDGAHGARRLAGRARRRARALGLRVVRGALDGDA